MINAAARVPGTAARMAGNSKFQKLLQFLKNTVKYGATGTVNPTRGELYQGLGMRLGMDAALTGLYASQAPGDLGDKVTTGLTDFVIGGASGIGTSGALRGITRKNRVASGLTDAVGSQIGFMASMPITEGLLRTKDQLAGGPGLSPYEKMDEARRKEIEANLLYRLGLM